MRRPLSMTIIGVIGVLWSLYALPMGVVAIFCMLTTPDWFIEWAREAFSPEYVKALENDGFRRTGALLIAVQLGIALPLLVGSVGLLRLKPIGWQLMMTYAVLGILWGALSRVVLENTVRERYRQELKLSKNIRPDLPLLPGILFPAVASYFLTRPKIAELYQQHWFTRED